MTNAQITIKERVSIPGESPVSSADTTAKTTAGITAPHDAWFKVFFDNAYKLSTGILTTAEMSFLRNGVLEATDLIIENDRLGDASTGAQDLCGQGSASSQIYPTGSNPVWTAVFLRVTRSKWLTTGRLAVSPMAPHTDRDLPGPLMPETSIASQVLEWSFGTRWFR